LSVLDNIRLAQYHRLGYGFLDSVLRTKRFKSGEKRITDKAKTILEMMDLLEYASYLPKNLPYGLQRRVELARALSTDPKLLLLDEPAAPSETAELMRTIRDVRDRFGVAIILIEHDMSLVMGICERILVLSYGLIIAQGAPEEIRNDPLVIEAYLGQQGGD